MKFWNYSGILFLIVGCAHSKVVGFNKSENTVMIQNNRYASEEDAVHAAENYCNGGVKLISMNEEIVGARTTSHAKSIGSGMAVGHSSSTSVRAPAYTFKCEKE